MATLYTQQDSNVRKTWFLMTMFLVVIIAIGWVFSQIYGRSDFVVIAVVFSLFMNFFSYWYSDKIVLKMSGATPASHEGNKELYHIVENLSITAGLPMPKVYIINEMAPNAFATGRDKEHAVVAVTTGLMQTLNKQELEGVIAHELAHIGNRDILISTIVVVLVGFVAILSDFFLRSRIFGRGDRDNKGGGALIIVGIALAILAPIATRLIHLAISRKREFLADASGALLTRYPEGLASALEKISKSAVPMRRASQATAHLYISNPLPHPNPPLSKGRDAGSGMRNLFSTHPPVEERVAALRGISMK